MGVAEVDSSCVFNHTFITTWALDFVFGKSADGYLDGL